MTDHAHASVATLAALRAARRTGILDALLDTADTPRAVAAETGVDERTATVLVDVLADRGFFDRVDDAYEPTNHALGLLTKTDLRSIGRWPYQIDRFDAYADLPATIQDDDRDRSADTPASRRNRLGYVQATPVSEIQAAVDAALATAPAEPAVLDVGGAPGPYATEFAARGHDVTLRDTPVAIAESRALLEPRAITLDPGALVGSERVHDEPSESSLDDDDGTGDRGPGTEPGTAFPAADLVFASDITPRLPDDDLEGMLAAAHDALTKHPGRTNATGTPALVLVEHVSGTSPTAPTRRLEALATGEPGDCRTDAALRTALETTGFDDVDVTALGEFDRHVLTATPRST